MNPLDEDAWDAWSPHELGQRLRDVILPWYVAGGWALDIWHDEQTREHEDLEFVVLRNDVNPFRATLHDLDFFTVKDGAIEYLPPSADLPSDVWQLWGADMRHGCWRVDLMIEQGTPDLWVYKHDQTISMARPDAVRVSKADIPYLAPANVMLFKARHCRIKDQIDFKVCLPKFSSKEKEQLILWLDELHPEHEWITNLQISG
ncbi:amino acid transporter [Methylobacterium sp. J-078]|uniref:nucleotidyltransferase domain-containing protein n=1 Tax=Methylobacterium sp. J-078 TaxID=2836657 RepID=UPI001FBB9034|nr:amino acid transporter [Methylobacterium sp. J-078]MCJ2048054.1 amino acid transporter [Methylobacterium sp. J-078]